MAGEAVDWLLEQHATLSDQPIDGRPESRQALAARLGGPPPEEGQPFADALRRFAADVAPHACRIDHPRFLAFIPAAPTFPAILGDLLCAGTNFFAGVWREASGPLAVELAVLDWFRSFLGMPESTAGILTGGGSEANLTGLAVARDRAAPADRPRTVLYLSEQRHWSVDRSARLLGFLPHQVRAVPCDDDYRMTPAALAAAVREDRAAGRLPLAVVANAGATNTGAVDPLDALADLCAAEGLWLHADAAYGWAAALTPRGRDELGGVGRADSVTLDPHKWLAQPYEVGCVLVREGRLLAETFGMRPEYMRDVEPDGDAVNFADRGLALTRRFRALKVWLSFQVLGAGWFRGLVARSFQLTELAEGLLRRAGGFEILSPRRLSVVCFRYRAPGLDEDALDRLNFDLVEAVRSTGRAFLSSTNLRGRVALRLCFVNWRTTTADVEEVVRLAQTLGAGLAARR
jgi:glutamate/tyrosine decarboxylase-like PLP-dependent enzyme